MSRQLQPRPRHVTGIVSALLAACLLITSGCSDDNRVCPGATASVTTLEPLGYLNTQLGYVLGMGAQIGLRLLHG